MERAFQTALWLLRPHIVFILGDIFDEGKWSSQKVNRPSVSNDDSYAGGKASALLLFIIIIIIIIIPNRPERLQNTNNHNNNKEQEQLQPLSPASLHPSLQYFRQRKCSSALFRVQASLS